LDEKKENQRVDNGDGPRKALFADADELVAFAQAFYATEFPNTEGSGCPPAEELHALARVGALPDTQQREHLFQCSECFRLFRSKKMGLRPPALLKAPWWQPLRTLLSGVTSHPRLATVGVLGLILFVAVAGTVWLKGGITSEVAMNTTSPVGSVTPPIPKTVFPEPKVTAQHGGEAASTNGTEAGQNLHPRRSRSSATTAHRKRALRVVDIDLDGEDLSRSVDDQRGERLAFNLVAERQRLRLRLPEGSRGGRYTISVLDAFGKSLAAAKVKANGKTLTATLDLGTLTTKKYRLCVSRDGEAPDCYLIGVVNSIRQPAR
jgi:hypothetical protein